MMERAYVCINCHADKEKEIVTALNKLDGVSDAHGTSGAYDIIVTVETDSPESINEDILAKIRRIDGIVAAVPLVGFDGEPMPDLIPDVIPEEKKPLEPPETTEDDEFDDEEDEDDYDDEDYKQKRSQKKAKT